MKKIILKITVLALILLGVTACDSKLDQIPFDQFGNENAYVSAADFENAVRGAYAGFTSGSMYGGSDQGGMIDAGDVLADNVTIAQDGRGTRSTLHNWRYVAADGPLSNTYQRTYIIANRANLILENIVSFEGDNKENIIAEAKAIRALAHLNSAIFFAKIPTQSGDANGSLGIAYVTEADANALPARETVGVVYDKIVADLTDALAGINETNPPGRLNKQGVATLLSRVYLYMGKYDLAVNAANMVTTKPAARNNVVGVWKDANQDGLLFYIPNEVGTLGIGVGVAYSQGSLNNLTPEYVVDYDFYTKFSDEDIRKEAYTAPGQKGSNKYNAIVKWFGRDSSFDGLVDLKVLRAAEAYLNKAEAYYRLGNETAARNALDEVRSRRYTTFAGGETGQALLDAIMLERRLEFAFEGHRFIDLKRWGLGVQRDGFGDLRDGTGVPSDVQSLSVGNKLQLPIDQTIIDVNPNIQQNPGY
ncbi:RagB/SusD family nutrient uptake outer membrane protein [Aequorivita todarodis]|uniref:RagB/SusD family nutrient uptake outer membrane protein n=1 Tax=Aequorivita todarodis TaxID=2036821 RepID=UPI002350B176|nr:RagB/SusD family nutrient uptake outer membrane protein [Aequorivita todarodis]MDC8001005.1 RagB/SusD family nutrient uptake outer membrane protein [Aequorivita todarodis]